MLIRSLVLSGRYLEFVQTLSDEVATNGEAVPFTPHVQVYMYNDSLYGLPTVL